ncbi:hypothetical protein LMH87_007289 [Akanthomyces muscarius]|uniref:Nephrocystin 3-like N-terminal domain-containing protein n=1 Tax=Akanthomyces muscarius TaxID=2231603 RepID=A0A9W8QRY7_AKAMU|nr:hypothetical protein LMH87_007289 [Akanthomyces muscarius]KAJ4165666.1 hypothetical protein LMH87_007289 [Akanthomyces muscarius]
MAILDPSDYTVLWLAPLEIELQAARLMLDEHHGTEFPEAKNCIFHAGRMCGYNVIIAHVLDRSYGVAWAASVIGEATIFKNIQFSLLVGVAAGLPNPARKPPIDIRLGDVLVARVEGNDAAIIPYGFGKETENDGFQLMGSGHVLEKTKKVVSSIISTLKLKYGNSADFFLPHYNKIRDKDHQLSGIFMDPGQENDILYQINDDGTEHIVQRRRRPTLLAEIPKPPDQNNRRRKRSLDEQSLCIRDNRPKNRRSDNCGSNILPINLDSSTPTSLDEGRKRALDWLRIDQIDRRYNTVKKAYRQTCEWLLRTSEYCDWLNPSHLVEHHGVLWIKGNPGVGKSTLMKFAVRNATNNMEKNMKKAIIYFFFYAQGQDPEKSTVGMYQSLLVQIFEQLPHLQSALDSFDLNTRHNEAPQWSVEQLEELFEQVVQGLGTYSLMCFIDALDECSEIEIRDMMSFFEELSNQAISRNIVFQVCFSSRWYPNITISKGLSLDLGLQKGHKQDILNYIDSKLKIGHDKVAKEVRMELEQRSTRSGLFMWVSLVVGILQRHYDHRGEYGLKKRLDDIPEDLHKLFHDILIRYKHGILTRDMHDKEHNEDELLLCMQCVLFARRPLAPQELYLALCPGASESGFDGMDEADARKLVLSSSRGLAEVTMSKETPKVQFIHESVRDFLLKGNGLYEVWPEVEWRFRGNSHERLKQCCLNYTNMSIGILDGSDLLPKAETGEWIDAKLAAKKAKQRLPFLEYAVESVFYHADTAAGDGVSQAEFFQSFSTADWMTLQYLVRGFTGPVRKRRLLYLLAEHNAANLISRHPEKLFCFKVEDEVWGAPVLAALATKSHEAVCAFMKAHLDIQPPTSHLHGLYKAYCQNGDKQNTIGKSSEFPPNGNILLFLLLTGNELVFAVALASGYCKAYTKFSSNAEGTLLHYAARYWYDVAVRELLAQRAHDGIDTVDERGRTPLSWAVSGGPAIMPRETKTFGRDNPVPLSCAAKQRQKVTVQLLLEQRADKEAADNHGATPLTWASRMGHEGIVQLLLARGAEIEATDENGWTPLSVAVLGFQSSSLKTIERLLEKGANVNATDKTGRTPLSLAVTSQHYRSNVPLLLDPRWGANINIADNNGHTPLSWAKARVGGEAIVPLLQSKGASLTAAETTG